MELVAARSVGNRGLGIGRSRARKAADADDCQRECDCLGVVTVGEDRTFAVAHAVAAHPAQRLDSLLLRNEIDPNSNRTSRAVPFDEVRINTVSPNLSQDAVIPRHYVSHS